MIGLESVSFAYPHKSPLFDRFSWQVKRGQSWAVLGPSGCGKTTLLYLLAGLLFPSAGQIHVDGQPLARPRPQTGLILQDFGLLPWNTLLDNVRLGLRIRQFYGPDGKHAPAIPHGSMADATSAARAWLERLGLAGLEEQYPGKISGGQRQRVAIARTLVLQPDLLLMDEPFSSLDAPTRLGLRDLTLALWGEQRFTFVVVTHAIEEAAHLGQFILLLGQPPHTRTEIIANPCFGQPDLAESDAYRALTRELRARMMEFGAQVEAS
ncbi:MAG: ATP-binding cassette domain-containing protein [Chloroflexi bacterium]|nr:MAG: ATP-binding cassette domain-containing protein [Chloroflexota bacterium]